MNAEENALIGATISEMKVAEDRYAILFITDKGNLIARVDADCCSETWVEHIDLPVLGFPAKVLDVVDLEMPDLGSPEPGEEIEYYGAKIVTDKGDIIIDYRNSSNGYYGGSMVWPGSDEYFSGGVYGQNISKNEWKEIVS